MNKHKFLIVTNNPLCALNARAINRQNFCASESPAGVLQAVREMVLGGYRLATHPLTSSIKPNDTPYKTVLLYDAPEALCQMSLELVENALRLCQSFESGSRHVDWGAVPQPILDDLALIDYDMVKEAIL